MTLSINEQTELEVLLSIEEPDELQKVRIEYLQNKSKSEQAQKDFVPADLDSMTCPCLHCFLATIPEHCNSELLVSEVERFFKHAMLKQYSFVPEVQEKFEYLLNSIDIIQGFKQNKPNKLSDDIKKNFKKSPDNVAPTLLKDSDFIRAVQESALGLLSDNIKTAVNFNNRIIFSIVTLFEHIAHICIALEGYKKDFSWETLYVIHVNISRYTEPTSDLSDLLSSEFVHKEEHTRALDFLKKLGLPV